MDGQHEVRGGGGFVGVGGQRGDEGRLLERFGEARAGVDRIGVDDDDGAGAGDIRARGDAVERGGAVEADGFVERARGGVEQVHGDGGGFVVARHGQRRSGRDLTRERLQPLGRDARALGGVGLGRSA